MSLRTRAGTSKKVSGIRSVENSNVGWFPTNVPAREPLYNSDPWADGSLLSELLALLLVDERSYVKEVEQIDEWGRVRGPPRLVLNGTETDVKSKAQAIQNLRICIRVLENIPNFPHIAFTPEDLYVRPLARSELLQTISTVFHLPSLNNTGDNPLHLLRNGRRYIPQRTSSAPPRLIQQRFPHIPIVNDPILQANDKRQQKSTHQKMKYDSDNDGNRNHRTSRLQRSKSVDRFTVSPAMSRSRSPSPSVSRNRPSSSSVPRTRYVPSQVRGRSFSNTSDSSPRVSRSNSPNTVRSNTKNKTKTYLNTLRNARHNHDTQTHLLKESYFRELDTPPRWRGTSVPTGVSRHSHTPTKLRFATKNYNNGSVDHSKTVKSCPTNNNIALSENVQQLQKTRALEMKRERLKVQQRDRRTRHSLLILASRDTSRHRDHVRSVASISDNEKDIDKYENNRSVIAPHRREIKPEKDMLRTGNLVKAVHKSELNNNGCTSEDFQENKNSNNNGAGYHSDTTSGTSSSHTTANITLNRPDWQWQPPKPSLAEIKAAETFVFPPVTATQQTQVRHWLCQMGVSLLDGEGGYIWIKDTFHQDNALHFPVTPVCDTPAATHTEGVLSLAQDRIRNGRLWLMLYNVLEPAAADSAQIPKLLNHLSNKTQTSSINNNSFSMSLKQCKAVVLKALWLWRMKLSPGIAVSYFVRAEPVIKGEKNLVWGLLHHIMQMYSSDTQNSTHKNLATTNLKPLAFSTFNTASNMNNATNSDNSSDSQFTQNILVAGLGYSVSQRRQLDQSLLQWLQEINILSNIIGVFPGRVPASLLALQSFLRDGTLLFHIAQLILKRSPSQEEDLPAYLPHKSPHSFAQCLVNVKCVLRALRMCRDMPRRLFSSLSPSGTHCVTTNCDTLAEAVCRGQWDVTLALLEDMHLLYDHYFVNTTSTEATGPYQKRRLSLTKHMYPYFGLRHLREQQIHNEMKEEQQQQQQQQLLNNNNNTNNSNNKVWRMEQLFPSAMGSDAVDYNSDGKGLSMSVMKRRHSDVIYDKNRKDNNNNNEDIFLKSIDYENNKYSDVINVHLFDDHKDSDCLIGAANTTTNNISYNNVGNDVNNIFDNIDIEGNENSAQKNRSNRYSNVDHMNNLDKENSTNNHNIEDANDSDDDSVDIIAISDNNINNKQKPGKKSVEINKPILKNKINNSNVKPRSVTPTSANDLQSLSRWLTDWLHLSEKEFSLFTTLISQVNSGSTNPNNTQTLGALFADGVLLGRLVMRLERTDLPGFVFRPIYPAQRWQNVRRSLECLAEKNRKLPLRLLSCEEAIVSGRDDEAVLTLLQGLRKAYIHQIP